MRVEAFLCDAARVREGLLHILGAGVSQITRPAFPAPLDIELAMMMTLMPVEARVPHKLQVVIQGVDGENVAEISASFGFGPTPESAKVTDPLAVPMVLNLRSVGVKAPGSYSVEVLVDSQLVKSLPFNVIQAAEPHNPPGT